MHFGNENDRSMERKSSKYAFTRIETVECRVKNP